MRKVIKTFELPLEVAELNSIINNKNVHIMEKKVFPPDKTGAVIVYLEYDQEEDA